MTIYTNFILLFLFSINLLEQRYENMTNTVKSDIYVISTGEILVKHVVIIMKMPKNFIKTDSSRINKGSGQLVWEGHHPGPGSGPFDRGNCAVNDI